MLLGPKITARLEELSTSVGGAGDVSNTWTGVSVFKGTFQPVNRDERQADSKDTTFGKYILFVAYNDLTAAIRVKLIEPNRIVIDGSNYNIIGVENFHNHHYEIYLRIVS